jgi:hypothetical protein
MATSNMWNSVSPMLTGLMGSPVESMYGGVTGYTPGAEPMPIYKNPPQNTPATPAPIDDGFYNSQIYKDFQNRPGAGMGTHDMYTSPYFGRMTSGSVGQAQDQAYEQYLASIGKPVAKQNNFPPEILNMLNGGTAPGGLGGMLGGAPGMVFGGAQYMGSPTSLSPIPQPPPPPNSYEEYLNSIGTAMVVPASRESWEASRAPASNMNNTNNFNFTPSGIDASGSYNTSDWLSVLGGLATGGLTGAASGVGVNDAVARLQALGQAGLTDYTNLAKTATEGINFTPYTLTSALGTTKQTAPGVISQELTPQQQANVNAAQQQQASLYGAAVPDTSGISQGAFTGAQSQLGQVGAGQEDLAALRAGYGTAAQGMTGMLGGSTTGVADQLFQQQQAMRSPVQQRQQLELENRLRAQGRLGTSTAAYGGTPEQLAMAKAVQEQQSADAFNSMTQAEQMATSQQARALGLGSATSTLAQAQQALRQGDIANAQGLFNIGSAAAQLPQQMQGQNIAQAGQLQSQALAPAAAQLQQAQLAGTMGQQRAQTGYQAGGLFASTAGAGLQERLTAESAAAALRGKQYTSALGALANKGGQSGTNANTIQKAMDAGIKKVGDELFDAGGKLLGKAGDLIGEGASALWDGFGNIFDTDAQFEKDWQAGVVGQLTSDDVSSGLIPDAIDSISSGVSAAWNWTKSLFDF